jgi:hypothetical protein
MAADLCKLCRGAGNLFCVQTGTYEWWKCPACAGAGVRALFSEPTYQLRQAAPKLKVKDATDAAAE